MSVTQLLQCARNIVTVRFFKHPNQRCISLSLFLFEGVNGPLQERMSLFDADRDVRSEKHLASRVMKEINASTSLLTRTLKIHLNLGQRFLINTSSVFISLETLSMQSLSEKGILEIDDARLRLPSTLNPSLNSSDSYLLRVRLSLFSIDRVLLHFHLVNFGAISPVWHFSVVVEHRCLSIDLFDLVRSTWR